ncbi:MAG: hypothetical protein U5P10_05605 [Spirochaetia bacterium]|nr:hypothetical protein [Spirochaetia bacterium]
MILFRGAAAFFCLPAAIVLLFWTSCTTPVGSGSGAQSASGEHGEQSAEAEGTSQAGEGDSEAEDSEAAANAQASGGKDASRQILLPPTQEIPIDQLMDLVNPNVPERFIFLSDDTGQPLRIFHDLDQNGFDDIFFLLVENPEEAQPAPQDQSDSQINAPPQTDDQAAGKAAGQAKKQASKQAGEQDQSALVHDRRIAASDLGDMSRLFSEEVRPLKFYLALFLRSPGGVVSMYRIPLSSWFVFEDFRGFKLDDSRPMPYAVSISFQTHEGKKSQWVSFSGYNEFSFFTLKNNLSVTSETRDINNNGILDILEWRRVFEEGTGYETFLTWYKWDGTKYAQHDSTNIVRNLNQFLHSAGTLMSMGKWEQAFSLMLPVEDADMSMGSLFLRLFTPLPEKDSGPEVDDAALAAQIDRGERPFSSVIVPRVLENPFAGESQLVKPARHTRFSIRFILRDGRSSVRECRVMMNENPFAPQQYYLQLKSQ